MATMSIMIDLRNFPKLGVRVPVALKRRAKQLALDLENDGVGFQGDQMTLEAIFAVAAMELMGMDPEQRAEVFGRRIPELIALFEKESPTERENPAGAGERQGSLVIEGNPGGTRRVERPDSPRSPLPRKRRPG